MENYIDSNNQEYRRIKINGGYIRLTYIINGWDNSPSIRIQIEEISGHLRQGPEIPIKNFGQIFDESLKLISFKKNTNK